MRTACFLESGRRACICRRQDRTILFSTRHSRWTVKCIWRSIIQAHTANRVMPDSMTMFPSCPPKKHGKHITTA